MAKRTRADSAEMAAAVAALRAGAVGVLPTDTIYGLVGQALRPRAVARIYRLRHRNPKKPVIILISSPEDLRRFAVRVRPRIRRVLGKVWPGPVSVVLPCRSKKFAYLHRGTKTLAFRLPAPIWLRSFLSVSGPLVAPSANTEGAPPARTIYGARRYFGGRAAFYVDRGRLDGAPSTLIALGENGTPALLRAGAKKLDLRRLGG